MRLVPTCLLAFALACDERAPTDEIIEEVRPEARGAGPSAASAGQDQNAAEPSGERAGSESSGNGSSVGGAEANVPGLPEVTQSDARYEAIAERVPPAVGQWVHYAATYRSGGRASTEYRIVGREGESWVLEITDRRRRVRHIRMVLELGEGEEPHRLRGLTFDNNGERQTIPARTLPRFESMLGDFLGMVYPHIEGGETRDVRVPAGTFAGARRVERELSFQDAEVVAEVDYHPVVPITGMVRFQDRGGSGHQLELVAFGSEGAEPHFQ